MTRNKIVAITAVLAVALFAIAAFFYKGDNRQTPQIARPEASQLVRPHSYVFGPQDAPVTIVEFFDPACEACRAFYPIVKQIMERFPDSVRLVLRYTTFHKGSDEVVRILETARMQKIFRPVLEALLKDQPNWASHSAPDISRAWETARQAGLDVEKARKVMMMPDITAILVTDMADVRSLNVKQTPTFFVNGKPLPSFGARQLYDLVRQQVEATRGKTH